MTTPRLRRPYAPMMQHKQLLRREGQLGVCLTIVIHELDFKHILSQALDDSANLSAHQTMIGYVRGVRAGGRRCRLLFSDSESGPESDD